MSDVQLHHGDCLDVMRTLPDASVDAVVTDPPYGLEFMGKDWDRFDKPTKGRADLTDHTNFTPKKSKFKNGVGTQVGMPKKNPRCRICSRLKFDKPASKCSCQSPDWDTRTRENAQVFGDWCELWTAECLRVLKPGGHMLAFGGTRTWHRLAVAIEDAGFEIRDSIAWMYGSGFPKSLDVSKAIDKRPGVMRHAEFAADLRDAMAAKGYTNTFDVAEAVIGRRTGAVANWQKYQFPEAKWWPALRDLLDMDEEKWGPVVAEAERARTGRHLNGLRTGDAGVGAGGVAADRYDAPATPEAERWQGWGTALKPAFEPVVVARKPLAGTVAWNVQAHGTGALNIDECRIEAHDDQLAAKYASVQNAGPRANSVYGTDSRDRAGAAPHVAGRWPANVVLDEAMAEVLDAQSGTSQSRIGKPRGADSGDGWGMTATGAEYDDLGGASRFFYVAKADASERVRVNGVAHPTVKPLALMRWLVRLVTPPGGTVLEPFAGSGTTVEACLLEGFNCIAIEREAEYLPLIRQRIARRRDPVEAVRGTGEDGGLFDLLGGGAA